MSVFPKYDRYKDSGVDSFGEIPAGWDVQPICAVSKPKSVRGCPDRELLSVYLDRGVIKFSDVDEKRTNATSTDLSNYQAVDPGDFVLNNQQAWRGSVGVSTHEGIVSPAYIILSLSDRWNPAYANYLFRDSAMVSQYLIYSKGVGTIQRNLYYPDFKRASVILPPKTEQDRIVTFLDRKTAEIDALISKKQCQIELLDEQKAILINRAVTRGLNPNSKLKPSGIEWIGDIPEHWDVLQNRRIFKEESRKITNKEELPLSLSQIDGIIPSKDMKERSLSPAHRNNFKLCLPGDLVVNRFKAHLGVFFNSTYRGIVTFHYGVFAPIAGQSTKYFELLYHTGPFRTIYAGASNGMTVGLQNLSNNNFYEIETLFPPIEEQEAIISYCDQLTGQFGKVAEAIREDIQSLKTLRSTLIAHAVTGRIKV